MHQEWIALSCGYGSPPSRCPCWDPHPFFSLYLFSLSLKAALNRWTTGRPRLKPGQWRKSQQTTIALFSEAKTTYKILNCWHRFSYSWQAKQGSNALFVPNMPKYSVAVSLWSGQQYCFGSVAMPCVSLWQARWLSPVKVIALLRRKYRTSHTENRQRLLFSSQKPG